MKPDDIKKIDINSINERMTTFDTGGGHRVFQPKKIGYKQLRVCQYTKVCI